MISIIVPNFNSGHLLVKNLSGLSKLLERSKLEYEIIVTDDCSTDNSLSILRNLSDLRILSSKNNTGFGSNVDRGIQVAKGEIVFVLNATDIMPESPDYFKIMLKHFDDKNLFSVGALKKDTETHGCGNIYFEKGFFLHRRGSFDYAQDKPSSKEISYTAWADGGAQAIRKDYYQKIGGFDPIYKLYWEDVDLGYRAWKAGYKIVFEPKAVLIHKKEEGPIAKFYSQRNRRIMNLRNQLIFTWKNADFKYLCQYAFWEPYHFLVAIKNRDLDWLVAYWQAFFQVRTLILSRWRQKKLTKQSDDEVLSKI